MKSEFDLYPVWQSFCRSGRMSICGRLQGIYSGELNCSEGPDFKDALFTLDGIRCCGDVEIHLRIKDWYAHGHHHDKRYNQVMLHLVGSPLFADKQDVRTSNGRQVPSIPICNFPPFLMPATQIGQCQFPNHNPALFDTKIKMVIRHRLTGLGRHLHKLTTAKKLDEVFYEGILRLLGSPQNIQNFEWLAQQINWDKINSIKHKFFLTAEDWYGIFLYLTGLLYTRREYLSLQVNIHRLLPLIPFVQLSRPMWKLAGQRPPHNPVLRLAGLALFVKYFPSSSLYQVFSELLYARYPYKIFINHIRVLFQIIPPPDFKKFYGNSTSRNIWGDDLLSEIIGNILIPFFYYQAKKRGSVGFTDYLESIYYQLPLNNFYACIRNFIEWPEIKKTSKKQFYIQQALLHIRQNFCLNNLCDICPIGRIPESR